MIKGTHILINAGAAKGLSEAEPFKEFILGCIREFGLETVGQVFHPFDTGGFTGVVCLTESHLALHTWPEYNYYTCDIYLCDYSRNNHQTALDLARRVAGYFESYDVKQQVVAR